MPVASLTALSRAGGPRALGPQVSLCDLQHTVACESTTIGTREAFDEATRTVEHLWAQLNPLLKLAVRQCASVLEVPRHKSCNNRVQFAGRLLVSAAKCVTFVPLNVWVVVQLIRLWWCHVVVLRSTREDAGIDSMKKESRTVATGVRVSARILCCQTKWTFAALIHHL
jgi:hypothetical protein